MLHMQHAQLAALLVRQSAAARQHAEPVAAAKPREVAEPEPAPAPRAPRIHAHGARPA